MRLIRLLIGAVIVFVLLVGVGLFFVPGDQIARIAADELTRRTGRDVQIAGGAKVTLWPELGVTVGALKIANAPWSQNGPMFQAEEVTIGVDAAALIDRQIKIRALRAANPEILLERNAEGLGNWELAAAKPAPPAPAVADAPVQTTAPAKPLPAFTLDLAEITNASIYFTDRSTGTEISQRGIDLTLAWPDAGGPARVDLTLRPNGDPVRLSGTVADPQALAGAKITDLDLSLSAPGGEARFVGRASVAPEAQGQLTLDVADTATLTEALGLSRLDLPKGLGRDLEAQGELTMTREGTLLSLRKAGLRSGTNRAALEADVTLRGARPKIRAQILAEALDLTGLTGGTGEAPAGGTPETGWSTAPIDASALGRLDGEISVTAASVDLGAIDLGATRAVVTIDNSRAVATLREVRAFGGNLTGEFVANNRNGLSVGGDLQASDIALQSLLSDLAGITRFTGAASARVKFLGVGQSVAAIMNSLSGSGGVDTGRGTIEGIDLDRLFRGGDPTGGTTIFDATNATFTMDKGVLRNDDLLMRLAGIEARGTGTVGLGQQQIDYLFTPVSLQARDGRGLAIPVRIRGAWANPKITVDVEKAIQLNAQEEKSKVEQKVRDEVARKLGIEQQDGESTEDALKRTLEEEAKKGLLKLLSR
ncbi:AsmA family protein [Pseudooceanicola onchidii]|uniref:AsmA family protein n=1 Tax=Pseudooceanicola onchidii TaxID=2562279 RepID=UPI0010A99992|nr:AsmA family protein [Pseudooceanicola onchidii]